MDLNRWIKVFDLLLPRSRAWNLVVDRVLRKFFHALAIVPQTIHEHLASILLEAFPLETTYLHDWSQQLGSWTDLTDAELEYEFQDPGGSSPGYLEDLLHDKGFPQLFVHEWWVPGSSPTEYRDPSPYFENDRVLVNDLAQADKDYIHQFGDQVWGGDSEFVGDESVSFGRFSGWKLFGKKYPTPNIPQEYPFYYYVCAETWPYRAVIYESQLRYLLRLIYKQKPCHLRCILRVNVIDDPVGGDGDIQDTTWEDDDIYDSTSHPDTLNDST